MRETTEEFLKRGGQINQLPIDQFNGIKGKFLFVSDKTKSAKGGRRSGAARRKAKR